MAGVAPTTTPTINVVLVFAVMGSGSWFAYLVATVAMLLVALNLVPFAKEFAGAGSLSEFVAQGLGRTGKLVTAWALLLAYLGMAGATLAGCTGYVSTVFGWAGVQLPAVVYMAVAGVLGAVCAWRDIRLSTGLMLGLEAFSVLLVLGLGLTILVRQGVAVDLSQLHLTGAHAGGLGNALLIGVLSFAGFEAAGTLGDEARRPLKDIPRALILTPLLTGLFFVFSAYVLVLGFNSYKIDVAASQAPLDELARAVQRPELGLLVAVGTAISLFACVIATMVAASRILFALGEQGAIPKAFAAVDGRKGTPHVAVGTTVGVALALGLALACVAKPLDIYDWLGTFSTFGCVIAYALTCVAAPIFLRRRGKGRARDIAIAAVALAVLGYVLYGSVYPVPAAPLNFLPWLFAGLLACGVVFSITHIRRKFQ